MCICLDMPTLHVALRDDFVFEGTGLWRGSYYGLLVAMGAADVHVNFGTGRKGVRLLCLWKKCIANVYRICRIEISILNFKV